MVVINSYILYSLSHLFNEMQVSGCGCHACMYYSRAYIHHLLLSKEMLAEVLLYNHNQYQVVELFQIAKDQKNNGSLSQWIRSFS